MKTIVGLLALSLTPTIVHAQAGPLQFASSAAAVEAALTGPSSSIPLPDAPGFNSTESASSSISSSTPSDIEELGEAFTFGGQNRPAVANSAGPAGRFAKIVQPGQTTQRLGVGDKILLGLRENASYTSLAGWVLSAAYAQVVNGSPNYGQTGKGFLQRLGAASARASSQNVFSDSVIAPILHQDPRYYRMGPGHNFVKRLAYAGTRGLITKTDGGAHTINISNIGGDLAGSALTQWYYPPLNRSFSQVMQTWGGSIGGDAVGYVVAEFLPNFSSVFHHKN